MKLKKLAAINKFVVHCSATPPSMDVGRKEIDLWHRQRSWLKIGYHAVIRRNGDIEWGRALDEVGAHVAGHNNDSLGICMVGGVDTANKPQDNFTPEQYQSLDILLRGLLATHRTINHVCGHRDLDPGKACPSFDVSAFLQAHSITTQGVTP